jgi:hypothetical protein
VSLIDPTKLTNDELIARLESSAACTRQATADCVHFLVEMDRRNLHLALGYRSLYRYCRDALHFSEAESYPRMQAASAARRFPVVLPMLAEGRLHLAAVRELAPHLSDENHLALLGSAFYRTKREVVALVANHYPRPDVPPSVRYVSPLGGGRYEFRFTGDEETAALLYEAQELLSHAIPDGGMAEIFKRGLAALVFQTKRDLRSATDRPGKPRPMAAESRGVSAEVEREVRARDGGQCAFVGASGIRCTERRFLHLHHLRPWAAGGGRTAVNIALRCSAHNHYEAKVYFDPIRRGMEMKV